MNPDQPVQPYNPNNEGVPPTNPSPLPSSAPEWQREAVANATAQVNAAEPTEQSITPTPGQVDPMAAMGQMPAEPQAVQSPQMMPPMPPAAPAMPSVPGMVMEGDPNGGAMPPTVPMMPGQPMSSMPSASQMPGNNGGMMKRIITVVVGLLILAGLGFGGYAVFNKIQNSRNSNATDKAASASQKTVTAPEINTLSSFSLVAPTGTVVNNFTSSSAASDGSTTLTNTDQSCEVIYGSNISQTDLPGTTIGNVVARATQTIKSQGVAVSGPNTESALVLKNASTKSTYSLPTVGFSYTKSGTTEVAVYSISQLKNGTHAAVLQVCFGTDSVASLTTKVNQVARPVAEAITVKTP